jgi:imidazoleglycerol-phosphate dehydratase/histidinol-phosphatase
MKRALFIDRDGTIIAEPPTDQQVDSLEKFKFMPGAICALSAIARDTEYELVMVTNQDGLGTSSFPEERFWPLQRLMIETLQGEGVRFAEVLIDATFEYEGKVTRKPGLGMLGPYLVGEYDLGNSFVIGDRRTDILLANNLGARGILFGTSADPDACLTTQSWEEVRRFVTAAEQRACLERVTKETAISIDLALYDPGRVSVRTGLGFFDHMLDLLAYNAGFGLTLDAKGDLHVDEHHLIEDVGITIGEAFMKALRSKVGLERYGFLLPMDEALVQVAVDLSERESATCPRRCSSIFSVLLPMRLG